MPDDRAPCRPACRTVVVGILVAALAACAGPGSAPAAPSSSVPTTTVPPTARALPTTSSSPARGAFGLAPGSVVVIDPGHNGGNAGDTAGIDRPVPDGRGGTKACNTTGAQSADGYPEHAFTWAVSQRLADRLRARGFRVVLTRDSDDGVGPCVDVRGTAGQRAGAAAVISVHADGGPTGRPGFHVLYSDPPLNAAQRGPSRTLADDVVGAMRGAGFTPATYIGRGGLDGRADIAGLNLSSVPTVLLEALNLQDADDAAVARSPAGQQRIADALAAAL